VCIPRIARANHAIDVVMRLIVLPLSAMHAMGPYQYHDLVLGLIAHVVLVELPISFNGSAG
jgi:hypothetical protein